MAHPKYDPRTHYVPAFDDGELFIDLSHEFTDSEKAKSFVASLNDKERQRLGGQEPDTLWFVAKLVSRVTIEWTDKRTAHKNPSPKKRVVRKKAPTP